MSATEVQGPDAGASGGTSPAGVTVVGSFKGVGRDRLVASPGNPTRVPLDAPDRIASVGRPPESLAPWHGVATVGNEPRVAIVADTELHGNPGSPVS